MERPTWFSRVNIKRLNVARRLRLRFRTIAHVRSNHYNVTANLRAAGVVIDGCARSEAGREIHATGGAPVTNRLAICCVKCDEIFAPDYVEPLASRIRRIGKRTGTRSCQARWFIPERELHP